MKSAAIGYEDFVWTKGWGFPLSLGNAPAVPDVRLTRRGAADYIPGETQAMRYEISKEGAYARRRAGRPT